MYLLLGDLQDPWCLRVRDALEARDCPTLVIGSPLEQPWRFQWRLNNEESASWLGLGDEPPISNDSILGVLVRTAGWIDPTAWEPEDLSYMQAEVQAAFLAWLWSLDCPVVNRVPSAIWYRPQVPLLAWQRLFRHSGLPMVETIVTNVESEARSFRQQLADEGLPGAVFGPLSGQARYLVTREEEWGGLASLQRVTPVCLAVPHGEPQLVCVIGDQVVWEGEPPLEAVLLEPALRRFADAAGLSVVELALAPTATGMCVIAVEPSPRFEHFGDIAREQIVEEIVGLLTARAGTSSGKVLAMSERRLS